MGSWAAVVLSSTVALADAPRFPAPIVIKTAQDFPLDLATGDLNGDGKLDLVLSSTSGSIETLLQDASDRTLWSSNSFLSGLPWSSVKVGDFDGNGLPDVIVSSWQDGISLLRGLGDGALGAPEKMRRALHASSVESGDWNGDGSLDLAVTSPEELLIVPGVGDGKFLQASRQTLPIHSWDVAALFLNRDGFTDLVLGSEMGPLSFPGQAGGSFQAIASGLFGPCARAIGVGDLDGDGIDDLTVSCEERLGTNRWATTLLLGGGEGAFRISGEITAPSAAPPIIEEIDRDGNLDVITSSLTTRMLLVHPGRGDGTVGAPIEFGPAGSTARSLLVADLDGDGRKDLVSAGWESHTVSILWGKREDGLFESARVVRGYTATSSATSDLDGDGRLDLIFNRPVPGLDVYLGPADGGLESPSLTIPTRSVYSALAASDFDGNGVPDVAGAGATVDQVLVTLLDRNGAPLREDSYPVGEYPLKVLAGRLHGDENLDLVVLCRISGQVAVLEGRGNGLFAGARLERTLDLPKDLALGDLDGDARTDVVVMAASGAAVHLGGEGHSLGGPSALHAGSVVTHVRCGDLTGDGTDDVLLNQRTPPELLLIHGSRSRDFGRVEAIPLDSFPVALGIADLDGDGGLDIHHVDASGSAFVIAGPSFHDAAEIPLPLETRAILDHVIRDYDGNGVLDMAVVGSDASFLFRGEAGTSFLIRRGDVDAGGDVLMADAIVLLAHLFQGGSVACPDAADTDDDGVLGITDAIVILAWLFQGGAEPASPGPWTCGPDVAADPLGSCQTCRP